MASIINVAATEGGIIIILVEWVGFGPHERT